MTFCCIAERSTEFTNGENKRKGNDRAQFTFSKRNCTYTRIGNTTTEIIQ